MNMDDVLEKLVKNVFYIVSVIVDIAAIIGLYKEITKDIPSITMLIIYAMVLMLAIIAAVAYSIVRANKKANELRARAIENTGDIFKVIHKELIHKVRNKLGAVEGEDYLSTSMRKDLLDTCGEILETLVKLQMALNGKKKISACIKLTLPIGTTRINDETKKETFLTNMPEQKIPTIGGRRNVNQLRLMEIQISSLSLMVTIALFVVTSQHCNRTEDIEIPQPNLGNIIEAQFVCQLDC